MLFGNVYNQDKRQQETKCCGFSMKEFIEKELERKKALGLTNTLVSAIPFEDLAIPFSYDSHDRAKSILPSTDSYKNKNKNKNKNNKKGGGNLAYMEVIPDQLFNQLFSLVAEVKGQDTNTIKRRTKKSRK
jgi:hypothetical protein